jgi:hypothetical protein
MFASSAAAKTPQRVGHWVTARAMEAQLETRYDSAFCQGLRRYGTTSLRTGEYSWDPGFVEFKCSYDIGSRSCYNAQFESDQGAKPRQWYVRMIYTGDCYS